MAVSKRTYKQHQSTWNTATSIVNSAALEWAEKPEHYFQKHAMSLGVWEFLGKNKGTIGLTTKGGINLQQFYIDVAQSLVVEATRWCDEAQSYMFNNHKWKNRTHNAEKSVNATIAGIKDDKLEIYLYHGMWYGVFLERSHVVPFPHAGDVSVIPETLQIYSPKLIMSLQHIIDSR